MAEHSNAASEGQAIRQLLDEVAELRQELLTLRVQKEGHRCIIGAMRQILCCLDPEFRRLSDAHIRGLRDHFASVGLDLNDPLVKATIEECESLMIDQLPLRETLQVIQGGGPAKPA